MVALEGKKDGWKRGYEERFNWTGGWEVERASERKEKRKWSKVTKVWGLVKRKKAVLLQKQEGRGIWRRHS